MTLDKLKTAKKFSRIPEQGFLLAVFEDHILLERYRKGEEGLLFKDCEQYRSKALLRLHCFDRNTEYRLLVTDDGERLVEVVLDADEERAMEADLLFEDEMLLRPEYAADRVGLRKLKVVNRYRYTDFDTMTLDNYRISC